MNYRHHVDLSVTKDRVFRAPWYAEHVPRRASDNLDLTKEWLQCCVSNHESCKQWCSSLRSSKKRPTRVVELTTHGVKLRCDVEDIVEFEYITLSHIWGTDPAQQLRLTTSRLEEFKVAIPADELPSIFREAIRMTVCVSYFPGTKWVFLLQCVRLQCQSCT
jgi:hypothetical protein